MKNKGVLELLQLPRMGRKTILKYLKDHIDDTTIDMSRVECLLPILSQYGCKVSSYTNEVVCEAKKKANRILEECEKLDIHVITYFDSEYPNRLKKCSDPPLLLYYKGEIACISDNIPAVAIIGTRGPILYGQNIAFETGRDMAEKGYVVVSGLAIGCDEYGHKGCLAAQGKTVAVLAGGLESIYPKQNEELAAEILENGGCLISEYPPNSVVYKNQFVERDRIQAALSDVVYVVETGIEGGTLHTAGYANEYNRRLACQIYPIEYEKEEKVQGNIDLIQKGAKAIENSMQLEELLIETRKHRSLEESEPRQITLETYLNNMKG